MTMTALAKAKTKYVASINEGELAIRMAEAAIGIGDVKRHTMQRLDSFIDGVAGKRLTYKALIH